MSKQPSPDDLHLAAQWLEIYEGAEDADACKRVAAWLRSQSDKAEFNAMAREVAKNVGRPLTEVKARLRQMNR